MTARFDRLSTAFANRYRIEREIGAGGMATVYLARDLKHDRQVAIKVLKPELAAAVDPERFLRVSDRPPPRRWLAASHFDPGSRVSPLVICIVHLNAAAHDQITQGANRIHLSHGGPIHPDLSCVRNAD